MGATQEQVGGMIVPCVESCPVGIDIPRFLWLTSQGEWDEALAMTREKMPFASVIGHICPAPCESRCRLAERGKSPVAIRALHRVVAEKARMLPRLRRLKSTGKRVAIIGSGPAGMSAAFYLRRKGHRVAVFESRAELGGMMRFGIPLFRLPQAVLEKDINEILGLGIELKTGQKLGEDFDLNQLKSEGYAAVFLAVGAQLSRRIELEGANLEDVLWGLDFLSGVREGKEISLKNRVCVVGGGSVAIDVARTALRLGAKEVALACLESREEMPAIQLEVEQAVDEGVKLMPSWGPFRILGANGTVSAIELVRCTSVFDNEGNFCPVFDYGTKEMVEADQTILAIGQTADLSFVPAVGPLKAAQGLITVDQDTLETSVPGIFAGGDATKAPGTVVEAIAAARRAASSIDTFLGGDGNIEETLWEEPTPEPYAGRRDKGFADLGRVEMPRVGLSYYDRGLLPSLPISERLTSFAETELSLTEELGIKEAARCRWCDLVAAIVDASKCCECLCCQFACSFEYQGVFSLKKSRIAIEPRVEPGKETKINFTEDCVSGCCVCARYCPYGAILVQKAGQ